MQREFIVESGNVACLPSSVLLTGTVSSSGLLVTGTGTDFVTDLLYGGAGGMQKYKYLYTSVEGQVIEIVQVLSPTTLLLKVEPENDLSAEDFKVASISEGYNYVSLKALGSGVGIANINEAPSDIDDTSPVVYSNSNGLDPIVVNATGSDCQITIN
jgi:hypothetical protein